MNHEGKIIKRGYLFKLGYNFYLFILFRLFISFFMKSNSFIPISNLNCSFILLISADISSRSIFLGMENSFIIS